MLLFASRGRPLFSWCSFAMIGRVLLLDVHGGVELLHRGQVEGSQGGLISLDLGFLSMTTLAGDRGRWRTAGSCAGPP